MICESCNSEIPDGYVICDLCNEPEPAAAALPEPSHRELATTVRRMKGLVFLSLVFGIFVAPFAVSIATRALVRHGDAAASDPATRRQLILLRRLAVALLIVWAVFIGAWARRLIGG